jgi:hypothetical protein
MWCAAVLSRLEAEEEQNAAKRIAGSAFWGVGAQRVRGYGCTSNAPTSQARSLRCGNDVSGTGLGVELVYVLLRGSKSNE